MRTFISISALCLVSGLTAGTVAAQPYTPNEAGVTMGHWHLNSKDIEANRKIFVAMGGTSPTRPGIQRVIFPGVVINLNPGQAGPPPTAGSVGSVVNHVGFVVQSDVCPTRSAGAPRSGRKRYLPLVGKCNLFRRDLRFDEPLLRSCGSEGKSSKTELPGGLSLTLRC
jgi:hypothetical protein